jgi:hypothetical protein
MRPPSALREHRARQNAEKLRWDPAYEDDDLIFCKENGAAPRVVREVVRSARRSERFEAHPVPRPSAQPRRPPDRRRRSPARDLAEGWPRFGLVHIGQIRPPDRGAAARRGEGRRNTRLRVGGPSVLHPGPRESARSGRTCWNERAMNPCSYLISRQDGRSALLATDRNRLTKPDPLRFAREGGRGSWAQNHQRAPVALGELHRRIPKALGTR